MMTAFKDIKIKEVCSVSGGKRLPKGRAVCDNPSCPPYIRLADFISGGINAEGVMNLPRDLVKQLSRYRVKSGDIIISVAGTLGQVRKIPEELDGAYLTENANRLTNFAGIESDYLYYVLHSPLGERLIKSSSTYSAQPKLALEKIRNFSISTPPLAEQERIAGILSDVDSAIAMTEKELNLVIARNKRLMLEFATSKSAGWETKRLSEIVAIKKGMQLNREFFLRDGNYPVYNGGVTHSGHYDRWNTEANTLTISEGGNAGYVRYVAERFWSGGHCYTLEAKDKKTDTKLVYFLLKAKEREVMRLRVGSALKNIQAGDLSAFTIQLPPRKMGAKISKALSVAEQEQEIMLALIAALKRQKRGLMQQLLTGKIRVLPKNNKGGKK